MNQPEQFCYRLLPLVPGCGNATVSIQAAMV